MVPSKGVPSKTWEMARKIPTSYGYEAPMILQGPPITKGPLYMALVYSWLVEKWPTDKTTLNIICIIIYVYIYIIHIYIYM